ncbi:CND2 protein, partial [Dicaeum eximium]|nr:CND2 protein [Dicaeum eximium]
LGEGDISTLSQHLSLHPGEYSYFSPRTLSMWAGPKHWRFQNRQPRESPGPEKASRQKIPKKPFEINFDEEIDFEPYFRKTEAPTTLSKSTLKRRNKQNTTLPEDFNYDPKQLSQLYLKPHITVSHCSDPLVLDDEDEILDYDYDNPSDTFDYCPAVEVSDSSDNSDPNPDPDPAELPAQATQVELPAPPEVPERSGINRNIVPECGELELIDEPPKVRRIPIPYATRPKRVDMRRLKKTMWELLTDQGEVGKGNSCWEFCSSSFP